MGNLWALFQGKKFYILGLGVMAAAVAESFGIDVMGSIDKTNYVDAFVYGWGVIAGRSTLASLLEKIAKGGWKT